MKIMYMGLQVFHKMLSWSWMKYSSVFSAYYISFFYKYICTQNTQIENNGVTGNGTYDFIHII